MKFFLSVLVAIFFISSKFFMPQPWSDYIVSAGIFISCICFLFRLIYVLSKMDKSRLTKKTSIILVFENMLPKIAQQFIRLDAYVYGGVYRMARGMPAKLPKIDGLRFKFSSAPLYNKIQRSLFSGLFFEVAMTFVLIHIFVENADVRLVLHCVLVFFSLYAFCWLLSDKKYVNESFHVLNKDILHIHMAFRVVGEIPLHAIECIYLLQSNSLNDIYKKHVVLKEDFIGITPLDKPNLLLIFKQKSNVKLSVFSNLKLVARGVKIYVDDPEKLKASFDELTVV